MPHDTFGRLLKAGDTVAFFGEVTQVLQHEEFCNVMVKGIHPAKPNGAMESFWFNTAQLERVNKDLIEHNMNIATEETPQPGDLLGLKDRGK